MDDKVEHGDDPGGTVRITFFEDSLLHGGTQIWVTEAVRWLIERGIEVAALVPEDAFVHRELLGSGAELFPYAYDDIGPGHAPSRAVWHEALADAEIAIGTVNPPRRDFQANVFAGQILRDAGATTHLIAKTGTVVPSYLPTYYEPEPEHVRSSVIAITGFTRRHLVRELGLREETVHLIYQGTDTRRFTPSLARKAEARQRYPLGPGDGPVLGCIGSFEERKGQGVLLEALEILVKGDLPEAHVMFVGDGPDEARLRAAVKERGLQEHVTFCEFTREAEYAFERFDLTVLPSYREGLPNVLLESMSMETPVVASNIAGIPEIVRDGYTGYGIPPGDAPALAAAVRRMWIDRLQYRRMCLSARTHVLEDHDKQHQFDRFFAHYRAAAVGHVPTAYEATRTVRDVG